MLGVLFAGQIANLPRAQGASRVRLPGLDAPCE
jgi:hypothetical protein